MTVSENEAIAYHAGKRLYELNKKYALKLEANSEPDPCSEFAQNFSMKFPFDSPLASSGALLEETLSELSAFLNAHGCSNKEQVGRKIAYCPTHAYMELPVDDNTEKMHLTTLTRNLLTTGDTGIPEAAARALEGSEPPAKLEEMRKAHQADYAELMELRKQSRLRRLQEEKKSGKDDPLIR